MHWWHPSITASQPGVLLATPRWLREPACFDRLSALDALEELKQFAPEREWRLILVDAALEDVDHHRAHLLGESACFCCCCFLPSLLYNCIIFSLANYVKSRHYPQLLLSIQIMHGAPSGAMSQ